MQLTVAATSVTLGGLLMVAMGVAVALVARTRANAAFAAYASVYGMAALGRGTLAILEQPAAWGQWLAGVCLALSGLALIPVGLWFPDRVDRADARAVVASALAGLTFLLMGSIGIAGGASSMPAAGIAEAVGGVTLFSSTIFVVLLLTLRYPRAGDERSRIQRALVVAGIGLSIAVVSGGFLLRAGDTMYAGLLGVLFLGLIVLLWLARTRRGDAAARNVALALAAAVLAGMTFQVTGVSIGANGVARGVSVAILGYAIVQHQLLGIDVRLRWAIKRSTLAAIFVVVFFVVTEGTQVWLGERSPYGEYLGIAAAGTLLFALAPLQRVAERVALAAVPAAPDERSAAIYRHALRAAMRDGTLAREEERHLAALADELGLPAREALRLREEVEAERAAA